MPLQGGLTVLVLGGHQGKGQGATTSGGGVPLGSGSFVFQTKAGRDW